MFACLEKRVLAAAALLSIGAVAVGTSRANGFVTAQQFAVSETGAATITIPIQVPRGIGGMEPQLALNYSSASGNGLLGQGWTLSGPSAISRCPKTLRRDGERGAVRFTVGDRYCLDGQRLEQVDVAVDADSTYGTAGTEYRTERDSFSRITAVGSYAGQATVPASFRVETKAGLKLEFGLSANSRVLTNFSDAVPTTPTINRWMLQRISDRHGSFVEFVYCAGEVSAEAARCNAVTPWTGSQVLHYIRYTNRGSVNGTFAVVLAYESRPDRIQGFHAGSGSRQTQRIARIETHKDFLGPGSDGSLQISATGTLVRKYVIAYDPVEINGGNVRATNASRIKTIQEIAADGSAMPPLSFSMASDLVFGQAVRHRVSATATPPLPPSGCGGVIANRRVMVCP